MNQLPNVSNSVGFDILKKINSFCVECHVHLRIFTSSALLKTECSCQPHPWSFWKSLCIFPKLCRMDGKKAGRREEICHAPLINTALWGAYFFKVWIFYSICNIYLIFSRNCRWVQEMPSGTCILQLFSFYERRTIMKCPSL